MDPFCQEASELIKKEMGNLSADLHFVSGGTQANLLILSSILAQTEAVIAPQTGHINSHEAGAVETTGHKICAVAGKEGKIAPKDILGICKDYAEEYTVCPRVVFISNSTELGTIYSKAELTAISRVCRAHNLYLYIDGARLGSALTSEKNDLTLRDLCRLADIFYIGGTKNGALLGEAVVITNDALKSNFRRHMTQRGALLAKGRVLGIQFLELFKNGLYFKLAKRANILAGKLKRGIKALGYSFLTDSSTNQIFPVFSDTVIKKLQKKYGFYIWSRVDSKRSSIRLVTSWATPEEAVSAFLKDLRKLS